MTAAPVYNLATIDVGQYSKPFLYDVDADNDLDLIVGRRDGKLSLFWNLGDSSHYVFNKDSANTNFGLVNVKDRLYPEGFSVPIISAVDTSGEKFLMVGCERGWVYQYRINPDSLRRGAFTRIATKFEGIDEGFSSSMSVADLNADGIPEFAIGNERGGVTMYSYADWDTIVAPDTVLAIESPQSPSGNTVIYPNPSDGQFNLLFQNESPLSVQVYDMMGRLVKQYDGPFYQHQYHLNLDEANGVYTCNILYPSRLQSLRIELIH
jgi:hypothetical protein